MAPTSFPSLHRIQCWFTEVVCAFGVGIGMLVAIFARGEVILTPDAFATAVQQKGIAGAALAVSEGRRLRIETAGHSTLERNEPVTQQTVFSAGSLGKPLFTYAILDLARRGRINLDRPLSDYLPHYFHQQIPDHGQTAVDEVTDSRLGRVTARMILSHTSGLPNWSRHSDLRFSFDPGARWQYSGEGFIYLQRTVEKLTGQPLEIWMKQSVFVPIGMKDTHFAAHLVSPDRLATGYRKDRQTISISRDQQALAPSTLLTTIEDYSRFAAALLRRHSESWLQPMFHAQVPVDQKLGLFWTLGLASELTPPRVEYFHWGANPGFQSLLWMNTNSGRWIVLLTNSDHGLELGDWLVPQVFPGLHPALRFPMLHPAD